MHTHDKLRKKWCAHSHGTQESLLPKCFFFRTKDRAREDNRRKRKTRLELNLCPPLFGTQESYLATLNLPLGTYKRDSWSSLAVEQVQDQSESHETLFENKTQKEKEKKKRKNKQTNKNFRTGIDTDWNTFFFL